MIWSKKTNGPIELAGSSVVYYNNSLFIIGGVNKDRVLFTGLLKYQIDEDSWSIIDCGYYPARSKFSAFMHNSELYVMFGFNDETQKLEKSIYKADLSTEKCKFTQVSTSNIGNYAAFNYGQASELNGIYIFGGVLDTNITNSLIKYSPSTSESIQELSSRYITPRRVIHSSLVTMAGSLYLFGGMQGNVFYNELWKFDISKTSWIKLKYYGDIPSPRSHHSAAADGDIMIIFGGKDSISLFNDAFSFNIITLTWTTLNYADRNPSARFGACLMVSLPMIYFYGGEGASSYSVALWRYNLSDTTYFPYEDSKGFDAGNLQGCSLSDDGEEVTILYGTADGDRPLGYVVKFNLTSLEWTKTFYPNDLLMSRSTALIGKVGENYYVIGGSTWASEAHYDIIKVEPDKQKSTIVGKINKYTYQSAYTRDKSKLYFYGGGAWSDDLIRYNVPTNNFYSLDFFDFCTDDCHLVCAPGSYYSEGSCLSCPEGTFNSFYGKQECEPCPRGTYNSKQAASSQRQCFPCNQGEFSNTEGNFRCKECEAGYFCPIGSINPIVYKDTELITSTQPKSFRRPIGEASNITFETQIIGSFTAFFVLLVLLCTKRLKKYIVMIDLYDNLHNYEDEVPLVTRKNLFGGVFTFFFFIAAFNLIVKSIVMLQMDNIQELKNLIPLVVLNEISPSLTGNVELIINFGNYGGDCINKNSENKEDCDASIFYFITEVQYSNANFYCQLKGLNCYVYLNLDDCEIDSTTEITLKLQEKFAYTSSIAVNLTTDSSIPNQKSSASMVAYPAQNTVFRGKDPTVFRFSLTPSYYTSDTDSNHFSGYHVSVLALPSGGTSYSSSNLGFTADLIVRISLERSINGLKIESKYIYTIYLIALTLIGSIPGVQQLIGGLMRIVEDFYLKKIETRKKKLKLDDVIGNRINMKDFLQESKDLDANIERTRSKKKSNFKRPSMVYLGKYDY